MLHWSLPGHAKETGSSEGASRLSAWLLLHVVCQAVHGQHLRASLQSLGPCAQYKVLNVLQVLVVEKATHSCVLSCRVVAISAGLLEETLKQHGSGSSRGGSSSSTASAAADAAGTSVLITYGDRNEVMPRQRVDR